MRQEPKTIAPVPQGAGLVAEHEGAGQLREAQGEQFAHTGAQQGGAHAVSGTLRTDKDPGQVRPAQAALNAIRRWRSLPAVTVPGAGIAGRQQSDQNRPDDFFGLAGHEAGAWIQGPSPPVRVRSRHCTAAS